MEQLVRGIFDTNERAKPIVADKVSPWLLSSFGWCASDVSDMTAASRHFQQSLLRITPRQFHLIGLSVALLQSSVGFKLTVAELAELVAAVPGRDLVVRLYGRCPAGLLSCLGKLPESILRPSSYIDLLKLLDDPHAAKVLFHADRINSNMIGLLRRLDPKLRRGRLVGLLKVPRATATIDFLINAISRIRPDVPRQAVLESLSTVSTAAELEKWFCGWIEKGTFPAPPWDGNESLVPLKSVREMHRAAQLLRNCLRNRVVPVIAGVRYYYLHRRQPLITVELVNDRLAGWLVHDMRGVGNKRVSAALAARIGEQFKAGGIGSLPKFDRLPRGLDPNYWLRTDLAWLAG